jgi:hypothetical protein
VRSATARAFTATGLDPTTNYTFTLTAYNDYGDSDYSYSSTASTTEDEWEDEGQVTTARHYPAPTTATIRTSSSTTPPST